MSNTNINTSEWKEFSIKSIFHKYEGKKYPSIVDVYGEDNFISSKTTENGITRVDGESCTFVDKPAITITTNGNCFTAFYQDAKFIPSTDVEVLLSPKINKYTACFLITIFNLEQKKWTYGRKPKNDKVWETKIKLPSKNEEPDWDYMENYIKNIYTKIFKKFLKITNLDF